MIHLECCEFFLILLMMRKNNTPKKKSFRTQQCCICGSLNCFQSTDHQRVTVPQLVQLLNKLRKPNHQFDQLKEKVHSIYTSFEEKTLKLIQKQKTQALVWINEHSFPSLNPSKVKISMLCQILQNHFDSLPNRRLIKQVPYLFKCSSVNNPEEKTTQLKQIEKKIKLFMSSFNEKKILDDLKTNFLVSRLNSLTISMPLIKLRKTISTDSYKEESPELPPYQWKNVFISKHSKVAQYNSKKITDLDMVQQLPIISHFEKLSELQLRNNELTDLTCSLIVGNLCFLSSLDIRKNKISDIGITKLVRGLKRLKTFMISENNISDESAKQITQSAGELQTLWCQQNRLTDRYIIQIVSMGKLKALSLLGNPISIEMADRAKKIFNTKGYISI